MTNSAHEDRQPRGNTESHAPHKKKMQKHGAKERKRKHHAHYDVCGDFNSIPAYAYHPLCIFPSIITNRSQKAKIMVQYDEIINGAYFIMQKK